METNTVIDLTIYDGRRLESGDFIPEIPQVRQVLARSKLFPPASTPTKRKHSGILDDSGLTPRTSKSACATFLIEISESDEPSNGATGSAALKVSHAAACRSEPTKSKRIKQTSSQNHESYDVDPQSLASHPIPSTWNGGATATARATKAIPTSAGFIRHANINSGNSEDAVTAIDRIFPVANLGRRASRLEVLAQQPIPIVDDEDVESGGCPSHSDISERRLSDSITSDDSLTDLELRRWLRNVQLEEVKSREVELNQRTALSTFRGPTFTCAPGKGVELQDGSFLRVKLVTRDGKGQVFVAGLRLIRQNFLGTKMPQRPGEIVWIQEAKPLTNDNGYELYEVNVNEVQKNREIIFTNQQYPAVSSRTDQDSLWDTRQDVKLGPLFCRWRMTATPSGSDNFLVEEAIEHLQYRDADDRVRQTKLGHMAHTRVADTRSRFRWRKIATAPGGSHKFTQEVASLDDGGVELSEIRSYTFGDAFCGAGGASRGALDAGLSVKWGFDMNEQAITSYSLNFASQGTSCRHQAVHEFLQSIRLSPPFVDILHISPPCQPFSHAHTVPSPQRDEINEAALLSVESLVQTLKPRIVTIEETDALMSRHQEWFSGLINIFFRLGYSTRWAALQCGRYGVPQTRKRLYIIACGPGERLPPFPAATHDKVDPSMRRFATINEIVANIPSKVADHDTSCRFDRPKPAYSGDTQAKTLTCKGGDCVGNYHPSGLRRWTIRELACLQTFPFHHTFAGARGITAAKVQIGNAVSPVLARALFRTIIKSLKETDGVA